MIVIIFEGFWYKRRCDIINEEINASVLKSGMKIYAEYQNQRVEISQANINRVINSVTDRLVYFSSKDEMPEAEPIVLEFGNVMSLEIYPDEGYDVFVKNSSDKGTKYYIIKETCSFKQLRKMVSVDEWAYPNILTENQ
jgi:hypothetical protein